MKKLLAIAAFALALMVSSCGKFVGYDIQSKETMDQVKGFIEENKALQGKRFTTVRFGSEDNLNHKFKWVEVEYLDGDKPMRLMINRVNPDKATPKEVSSFFNDKDKNSEENSFTLAEIPFDKIPDEVAQIYTFLGGIEELSEFEISGVRYIVLTKKEGKQTLEYTIQLTKKGEGSKVQGRNIVTNYYEFTVKRGEDGEFEINE